VTVTSSATEAREHLIRLLKVEYAPERIPVLSDRLHASVGNQGAKIGVSPVRETPWSRSAIALQTSILVQFYDNWDQIIDPTQTVDPAKIENHAERFKRLLRDNDPQTDHTWYFTLVELSYPPDPTDNITRFEATVTAWGNNPALVETTG
jgi:hypothetical protein